MVKSKKVITLILCMTVLFSVGLTTHAETKSFTLTVTSSGHGEDTMSRRTLKAGGDKYENLFHVTPHNFTGNGEICVKSIKYSNKNITSDDVTLSYGQEWKTKTGKYKQYAAPGEYYYLQGRYKTGPAKSINVTGNYTP